LTRRGVVPARMAATETPQTPTPSWIHPSAASFYASDALRKTAQRVKTRRGVLNVALDRAWRGRGRGRGRGHLLWLEFGVWKGDDIAHIASWLREKHRRSGGGGRRGDGDGDGDDDDGAPVVHGFDSFEGLPAEWRDRFPAGAFDLCGAPPPLDGAHIELHKGWFEDTVRAFLDDDDARRRRRRRRRRDEKIKGRTTTTTMTAATTTKSLRNGVHHANAVVWEPVTTKIKGRTANDDDDTTTAAAAAAFVHADADLHASTATFLTALCERGLVVPGTVIVFDEYVNYDGWERGEFLAWEECRERFGRVLSHTGSHTTALAW
jgi:hypothetical protein